MKKTLTLETISYRNKRAKFQNDLWLTLSPFINLQDLKFNHDYELDIQMDHNGLWYVDSMVVASGK